MHKSNLDDRFRKRCELVAGEVQRLHLRQRGDRVGQRRQLVAVRPELGQPGQDSERVGDNIFELYFLHYLIYKIIYI